MNRSLSSKLAKKASPAPSPAPATENKKKKKKKEQQSPRNPLKDLNATITTTNSNHGSEASSSISIEAPRGCLRFFLSNSKTPLYSPRTLSKTPKSAPVVRPLRPSKSKSKCTALENQHKPISRNLHKSKDNSSCLYQWQSGNKPTSRNGKKLKTCSVFNSNLNSLSKLESGSEVEGSVRVVGNARQPTELKSGCGGDGNFTPLSKIATGLALDFQIDKAAEDVQDNSSNKTNSTTPPVQASVSPEIQCGSSAVSTATLSCYATGHVLSGITDKRKCRPRGILSVGDNDSSFGKGKALGSFEEEDDGGGGDEIGNLDASMVPLPTEASMHWLLPSCNEEDEDHKEHSRNSIQNSVGSIKLYSPFSASCHDGFSSDLCDNTNMKSPTNCIRRSTSVSPSGVPKFQEALEPLYDHVPVLSSPSCTPGCEVPTFKDKRNFHYDFDSENSPFSMPSLGSGNVICTPQSDSSLDNQRNHYFDSELSSVAEAIRMASLSPTSHVLIEDQTDSSFQFDCLTTTCNSISRVQKILDDRESWLSNSTLESLSQCQMRISWREGLMSRIYDMEEFDCCRCLSDEEEDDPLKKNRKSSEHNINVGEDQISTNNSRPDDEPGVIGKAKEGFSSQSSGVCAESISTDGGGLLASGDSDWSLCYKNELFHV